MKKLFLSFTLSIAFISFASAQSTAQWIYTTPPYFILGNTTANAISPLWGNSTLNGNAVRIQNTNGTLDLGPQNGSFCHIYSSSQNFIFNKSIFGTTGLFATYNTADMILGTGTNTTGGYTTRMTILNSSGNVGIGVSPPLEKLDVMGSIKVNAFPIYLAGDHNHGLGYYGIFATSGGYSTKVIDGPVLFGFSGGALGTTQGINKDIVLNWSANGRVGIGVPTPIQQLDINGGIKVTGGIQSGGTLAVPTSDLGLYSLTANSYMRFVTNASPIKFFTDGGTNSIGGTEKVTIDPSGKVLIGNPSLSGFMGMPGSYLLYVQQGILTERVKVAVCTSANWADYVFDAKYKLKDISELELFVKTNKHLPNIPSANEMVKEGLDVATMDAKLLEKIEELTLYIIEQNKRIEALEQK
jgi:hypothetical protein